jgi:predicted PurR-regulated permease PerM
MNNAQALGWLAFMAAAGLLLYLLAPVLRVALVFVVTNVSEGCVLSPRLVGSRIGLHPTAVIFADLAGGTLFGFLGVLAALPAAVLKVWLRHLHRQYVDAAPQRATQPKRMRRTPPATA